MRTSSWITCLWGLGLISLACVDDRPIYVDTGAAGTNGAAGTTGAAGTFGAAGTTGIAGTHGAAGATAVAGTGGTHPNPAPVGAAGSVGSEYGCAQVGTIFETKNCALTGACHDAAGSAANFSLTGLPFTDIAGWRERLVGQHSTGGGVLASACANSQQFYLAPGSFPATGLFLNKLRPNPSCGERMPVIGDYLTASELDCVQRWANLLTVPPPPDSCPITCGAGTYCRITYDRLVNGVGIGGAFACHPLPVGCSGGVADCNCVPPPGCYFCQKASDYLRCSDYL
jgi:hypothetical protein